ncbi:hypothetical protein ACXIUS_03625 [Bosea thiooxidans]|nr:hypothetical protein [Bosea sp. (in: a-proteobacteria)]
MATELALDTILKVAGVGGVAAAIVNQVLKTVVDAVAGVWKRRADATYAAVRSVVMLERYVQRSEAHLTASEIAADRRETLGSLPLSDPLPSDVNWRAFNTKLAFRVLSFPAEVEAAQARCDLSERETGFWGGDEDAIRLGLAAWDLAVTIRKRYRLGHNTELAELIPLLNDRKMEKARRHGQWLAKRYDKEMLARL